MRAFPDRVDRFRGVLLGTAVGDALGLPAEGVSRRRARRLFPGPWRHRLVLGRGMVSDDTEHALFVAQSLLAHPHSAELFVRRLAWCLRGWLLSLPAGVGFATLRAILRLWLGVPPDRSGVASAGNGPAMRAAPLGAFLTDAPDRLESFIAASTRITHSDPRALTGARAIAELTAWCVRDALHRQPPLAELIGVLERAGHDTEWRRLMQAIEGAAGENRAVTEFADQLGLASGVSGYIYHTVPVAVYAWWRHFGDFEATVTSVLECGGDTDTVGAVAGALAGAVTGAQGIPAEWVRGIRDWPRGPKLLARVAERLAEVSLGSTRSAPVRYFWPAVVPRNVLFLAVVLVHGLRRMAPPF